MGRNNSIELLPAEQQVLVHNIIRSHRYCVLDKILDDIKDHGLEHISRSSLGRYVPKLKVQDSLKSSTEEDTVVTIVERSTGKVLFVRTGAAAELVAEKIAKLNPLMAVS